MKSQTPVTSGVSVRDILEEKYPDIKFKIEHEAATGVTWVIIWKIGPDGKKYGNSIRFAQDLIEQAGPGIIDNMLENAVKTLRNYMTKEFLGHHNPSSRWFG